MLASKPATESEVKRNFDGKHGKMSYHKSCLGNESVSLVGIFSMLVNWVQNMELAGPREPSFEHDMFCLKKINRTIQSMIT